MQLIIIITSKFILNINIYSTLLAKNEKNNIYNIKSFCDNKNKEFIMQ